MASSSQSIRRTRLPYRDTELDSTLKTILRERGVSEGPLNFDSNGTIIPSSTFDEEAHLATLPYLLTQLESSSPPSSSHLVMDDGEIGRGAMGVVRVAQQLALRREVAVKAPLGTEQLAEATVQLLREGRVTGALAHPNVVPVYMLGRDAANTPLLVMKRISGLPWFDLILEPELVLEREDVDDPLEWHLDVLMQVCNAVHYGHSKGVIHRDLKPDNVMIGEFGEIYVLDWGLAVSLEPDNELGLPHVGMLQSIAGTPGYMPPEMVVVDKQKIGVRSDVYLLGGLLHTIITGGEPRHEGSTVTKALVAAMNSRPLHYASDIPSELVAISNRATAKEPDDRYASAEDFRRDIAAYLRHRHSRRLSVEARARFERLQELIAEAVKGDEDQEVAIYRLFGECRFGFRQAMREWAENENARSGLQVLLESMATYELREGDYRAASKLIAEFPDRNESYDQRLEALREKLELENSHLVQLRALERAVDSTVGRRERALLVVLMGFLWGGFYATLGVLSRTGVYVFEHGSYVVINAVFGAFLLVASVIWREKFMATTVNRNFLWSVWTAFGLAAVWWPLSWSWGLEFTRAMTVNLVLYATVSWMAAAAVDMRIRAAGAVYFLGAIILGLVSKFSWEILAGSTMGAMFMMAWVWRKPRPAAPSSR